MSAIATGIASRHLHHVWPDLWPLLEPAYAWSPEKEDVLAGLMARDYQLWAIYDGGKPVAAIVTRIWRHRETGEGDCRLWLVGGRGVHAWLRDFIDKLTAWARAERCTRLTASGRRGWWRLVKAYGGVRIADEDGAPAWALDIR